MGLPEFVAGWALGSKTGSQTFDDIVTAAKGVLESKEFKDLTAAARAHAGHTLRQLGDLVSRDGDANAGADVLDMVRVLTQRQSNSTS